MEIQGQVLNASIESRELVGKDGTKRTAKISHVLLMVSHGNQTEIVNLRSFDADWALPKVSEKWTTPRVKRYECFDGQVADVTV